MDCTVILLITAVAVGAGGGIWVYLQFVPPPNPMIVATGHIAGAGGISPDSLAARMKGVKRETVNSTIALLTNGPKSLVVLVNGLLYMRPPTATPTAPTPTASTTSTPAATQTANPVAEPSITDVLQFTGLARLAVNRRAGMSHAELSLALGSADPERILWPFINGEDAPIAVVELADKTKHYYLRDSLLVHRFRIQFRFNILGMLHDAREAGMPVDEVHKMLDAIAPGSAHRIMYPLWRNHEVYAGSTTDPGLSKYFLAGAQPDGCTDVDPFANYN